MDIKRYLYILIIISIFLCVCLFCKGCIDIYDGFSVGGDNTNGINISQNLILNSSGSNFSCSGISPTPIPTPIPVKYSCIKNHIDKNMCVYHAYGKYTNIDNCEQNCSNPPSPSPSPPPSPPPNNCIENPKCVCTKGGWASPNGIDQYICWDGGDDSKEMRKESICTSNTTSASCQKPNGASEGTCKWINDPKKDYEKNNDIINVETKIIDHPEYPVIPDFSDPSKTCNQSPSDCSKDPLACMNANPGNDNCTVCRDGKCVYTDTKHPTIITADTDFKTETVQNKDSVPPNTTDMLQQLRDNKFNKPIPPVFNLIKNNASGGLLVENTSDKTIYVYIDITKPPCLPSKKGACSPPKSNETCDSYTLNDDSDNSNYSKNYTQNGVDVCSWDNDNNDAEFYIISKDGQSNKINSKSNVKLDAKESWFIKFPRDEDGVFWWCNNGIIQKDQRICPGLGLYVTNASNTFSASCLNRYEFNININKDVWYDKPYEVQYTYHNLSSVDGFNSTMSLDIYQPYKCISKNKDPTKTNNIDCTGMKNLSDIKEKCSKTLTYSTQELSVKSENDVNSILTCANPSHLNKNYEDHLACAMQSDSDLYDCTGMKDLYGITGIDQSATKNNYFEIDSRYDKITSKLDCHRYWDKEGSLTGIMDDVDTWFSHEDKYEDIFKYTKNDVQKYRDAAQNYKNYIKDTLKCETYSWAFDEQTCKDGNCNKSVCSGSPLKPGDYLKDNTKDPLKKCPLLNPYVNNSSDVPSIDTSKIQNNYLYLHLKIGDVISDDDIDKTKLIQGNEICSSNHAQVCQANCEGKNGQNPCQYNETKDVKGKYCHPLDCDTYTSDGKKSCESRKTSDGITLCKFIDGKCKNNMENYSISGLCSSTVTKIGTQSLNPKNMENVFYQ